MQRFAPLLLVLYLFVSRVTSGGHGFLFRLVKQIRILMERTLKLERTTGGTAHVC